MQDENYLLNIRWYIFSLYIYLKDKLILVNRNISHKEIKA